MLFVGGIEGAKIQNFAKNGWFWPFLSSDWGQGGQSHAPLPTPWCRHWSWKGLWNMYVWHIPAVIMVVTFTTWLVLLQLCNSQRLTIFYVCLQVHPNSTSMKSVWLLFYVVIGVCFSASINHPPNHTTSSSNENATNSTVLSSAAKTSTPKTSSILSKLGKCDD